MKTKVTLLVREYREKYGLARYTAEICRALRGEGLDFEVRRPGIPWAVRAGQRALARWGYDPARFLTTYPLAARLGREGVTHLTTQQMATLLWFKPGLRRTVVTVHDIVPYLVRGHGEQDTFRHGLERLFDGLAMRGLRRADVLVAASDYTRRTLVAALGVSGEKIRVAHYGVDHGRFRPVPGARRVLSKYGLGEGQDYVLYAGAESPRKNLPRLVRAFATISPRFPKIKLVKVGTPEYLREHAQLAGLVRELGLEGRVVFLEHPREEDLVALYNGAAAFVFPSLYEGFGMPPLEAMACGAPVVCSKAASLPEVVGEAAVMVDPYDVAGMGAALERVLADGDLREALRRRGPEQASKFSWERAARETIRAYEQAAEGCGGRG